MAKSKQMCHWNIASSMMALAAEINPDRRRRLRAFRPEPNLNRRKSLAPNEKSLQEL
jgi:hypothetical protein